MQKKQVTPISAAKRWTEMKRSGGGDKISQDLTLGQTQVENNRYCMMLVCIMGIRT